MSLPLLITINVLFDIALLGGLAYAMSRATRLTPHVGSVRPALVSRSEQALARQREQRSTHLPRPDLARARASMGRRAGADGTAAYESAG